MDLFAIVRDIAARYEVDESVVFAFDGHTYAMLFLAYSPQEEGALMVDNYYPAYQRVRRARLALEEALPPETKQVDVAHGYKGLAVLSGKARALRNALTAIDGIGSWYVMETVCVEGVWAPEVTLPEGLSADLAAALKDKDDPLYAEAWYRLCLSRLHPRCADCRRCQMACPQGAIGDVFAPDKCLRHLQAMGYVPDSASAKRMGQRVLGCHTCQKVCPLNDVPSVPPEIDGVALLRAAVEGKRALEPFADCLGNNYLRPAKLVALCLNALGNAGDGRWRDLAIAARDRYDDPRVQQAVDRYLRATPDVEREVKYLLSEANYRTFSAIAAEEGGRSHIQTNHYFDAGEYARARIREKDGKYMLTVKRRIDSQSLYEHNAYLSREETEACLSGGLSADLVHRYLGLDMPADAPYEGSLTTRRTTWRHEGLTLELDESRYLGAVDYEIECEVTTDEDWDRAVAYVLAVAPEAHTGEGKQRRFENRKRVGA